MSLPAETLKILGRNTLKLIQAAEDHSLIPVRGPMSVWAYLIMFHMVAHRFSHHELTDAEVLASIREIGNKEGI